MQKMRCMAEEGDGERRQKSAWIELISSSVVSLQQAKAIFPARRFLPDALFPKGSMEASHKVRKLLHHLHLAPSCLPSKEPSRFATDYSMFLGSLRSTI